MVLHIHLINVSFWFRFQHCAMDFESWYCSGLSFLENRWWRDWFAYSRRRIFLASELLCQGRTLSNNFWSIYIFCFNRYSSFDVYSWLFYYSFPLFPLLGLYVHGRTRQVLLVFSSLVCQVSPVVPVGTLNHNVFSYTGSDIMHFDLRILDRS